jgi:hypothetical protein
MIQARMAHDVKLDQIDWSANFLFLFLFFILAVHDNNSCPLSYTFRTNKGFGSWMVVAEGGALQVNLERKVKRGAFPAFPDIRKLTTCSDLIDRTTWFLLIQDVSCKGIAGSSSQCFSYGITVALDTTVKERRAQEHDPNTIHHRDNSESPTLVRMELAC